MLFDTHTHVNVEQFADDREEVIERAFAAGVNYMTIVGFDRETIPVAMDLAEKYETIYAAIGWHPVDAIDMEDADLEWIKGLLEHPKVVAVGETGLDYHWDKSPVDIQKKVFRKQIKLAKETDMPLIIHNREATQDIIRILQEENAKETGGIMHCYNDDVKYVQSCLDMNFYISLGGPVTFKNATMPKDVAVFVPSDRLLVETDAPFLAPHPNRGKRNEPAYVTLVADKIAELRGISSEKAGEQTTENAFRVFKLNE